MNSQNIGSRWRQVNLWCDDWQAAEQVAVTHLGPLLIEAEHAETIISFATSRSPAKITAASWDCSWAPR